MGYYLALAQVGMEMAFPALLGYWLDDWLGTTPWITSSAAVFGFIAGMLHLIMILRQKERDERSDKKPPP
jgi:F0F1-type ATP synthase assembly protein I